MYLHIHPSQSGMYVPTLHEVPRPSLVLMVLMVRDGERTNWVSVGVDVSMHTGMQLRDKKRMFPNGRQDKKGFIFGLLFFRYKTTRGGNDSSFEVSKENRLYCHD
jgi:hypothetical protein